MCGILASFSLTQCPHSKFLDALSTGLDAASHRGPDGFSFWHSGNHQISDNAHTSRQHTKPPFLSLGHRRLSILDLSDNGIQPFSIQRRGTPNDKIWLTYNGEIYNYIELRETLRAAGHSFHTETDTEVLLRAYEQWGLHCFERFNGMWALVLWDERNQRLVVSRDRMGVKPLYYTRIQDQLVFASEIKQLIAIKKSLGLQTKWNAYRVYEFLAHSRQHHSEETLYDEIYAFRPSHYSVLSVGSETFIKNAPLPFHSYWQLPAQNEVIAEERRSYQQASQELRTLLESAVALRLRSDVPVGSALSGGIDSSSIVSIMANLKPKNQKTFSAVFPGEDIDEEAQIRLLLSRKNIESFMVQPQINELINDLPQMIYHQDGPVWSTSIFAQWSVFRIAHENKMKVMLDGQGADELFAGYEGFFKDYVKTIIQDKGWAQGLYHGFEFAGKHRSYFRKKLRNIYKKKSNLFSDFSPAFGEAVLSRMHHFSDNGDPYLLGDNQQRYTNPLKEALYRALTRNSLPALLMFEDRNSMAFSIESRTPFLDYRIMEFAFRCPHTFLVRNGVRKSILRNAVKGLIPEEIRTKNEKIGFATPEKKWLNHIDWEDLLKNQQGALKSIANMGQLRATKNNQMIWKFLQFSFMEDIPF